MLKSPQRCGEEKFQSKTLCPFFNTSNSSGSWCKRASKSDVQRQNGNVFPRRWTPPVNKEDSKCFENWHFAYSVPTGFSASAPYDFCKQKFIAFPVFHSKVFIALKSPQRCGEENLQSKTLCTFFNTSNSAMPEKKEKSDACTENSFTGG